MGAAVVPQYTDVPEGFTVEPAAFSDIPAGFAVAPQAIKPTQPTTQTEATMRRLGLIDGIKSGAAGLADVAISGARGLVNKPAASMAGLVGAINPNDTYMGARDRARADIATDRQLIRDDRLRTPQGPGIAAMTRAASAAGPSMPGGFNAILGPAIDMAGRGIEAVFGPEARDFAGSAASLATLRAPAVMRAEPRGVPRAAPPRPVHAPAPALEELRLAAQDAYTSADNAGVVISRDTMARIAREVKGEMAEAGIDATLHPDSMAALNRLTAAGAEHHSLKGAEILRRIIKDAEASTKPADAQKASIMRDAFDERMEALGENDVIAGQPGLAMQILQDARQLYSRTAKGEDIDELFRRAELKAGANYTAAGIETALRQEFRALAMNRRRFRRFTAEEQAAIERVAKGGGLENAMRYFGKFAASSPLALFLSSGLGMMFGGPVAAVAAPIAGLAARRRAAQLTTKNANAASELVRRGPTNALYRAPPAENALARK